MSRKISLRDGDEQHREPEFELCTTCGGFNFTPVLVLNIAVFLVVCVRCGGNRIEPKLTWRERFAALDSMRQLNLIVRGTKE